MRTQRETDLEDEVERLTALLKHGRRPGKSNLPYIAEVKRLQARVDELEAALDKYKTGAWSNPYSEGENNE